MQNIYNNSNKLDDRSYYLRSLVINALRSARRGHFGPSMSLMEIMRVLYDDYLNYDPKDPLWEDRDRFILSKGHGCLALYALLADKGFFRKEELLSFCKEEAMLGGHPERGLMPGVEASTGALGHGLSIGVGIALAARIKNKNYRVVVVTGDGELNEGSIWEAAMSASKHRLSNLTVFVDYNKLQCYGTTKEVLDLEPLVDKWKSFGFAVIEANGHDIENLRSIVKQLPLNNEKPTVVICHTIKGCGFPFAEHNPKWHYLHHVTDEQLTQIYEYLPTKCGA